MPRSKPAQTFPLRLPNSLHFQAIETAVHEGVSLNQFIMLAVAERIQRLEKMVELQQEKANPVGVSPTY